MKEKEMERRQKNPRVHTAIFDKFIDFITALGMNFINTEH